MARGGVELPPQQHHQLELELLLAPPAEQQRPETLRSTIAQRGVASPESLSKMDHAELVALYLAHVLPRPQRELRTDSHWAQRVVQRCGTRAAHCHVKPAAGASFELKNSTENRKRPLIVFDGASTKTVIKVRRVSADGGVTNSPAREGKVVVKNQAPSPAQVSPRLPEPSNGAALPTSPSCTISKGTPGFGSDTVMAVKVKRVSSVDSKQEEHLLGSPEVKSKIQRIKWP